MFDLNLSVLPLPLHQLEREKRGITKIALDSIAALLLHCFPFASVFNGAARSLARESRFQFEITRVAWHSEEEVEVEGRREAG